MCREHDAGAEDLSVVIESEPVHGEAVDEVDHPGVIIIENGHRGLARALIRSLLLVGVIGSVQKPGLSQTMILYN